MTTSSAAVGAVSGYLSGLTGIVALQSKLTTFGAYRAAMTTKEGRETSPDPVVPDSTQVWVVTASGRAMKDGVRPTGYAMYVIDAKTGLVREIVDAPPGQQPSGFDAIVAHS